MNIEKILHTVYTRKPVRPALHLLFWAGLIFIQQYLVSISFNNFHGWPQSRVFANIVTGTVCNAIFYYPFVYWVIPRYLYRKRFAAAVTGTFVLLIIYALADIVREELIIKTCSACMAALERDNSGYAPFLGKQVTGRLMLKVLSLGSLIGLIFNIALPLSIKYAIMFLRQQILSLKLSQENLQLEFDFLRSQVNPHFLFNTMNNIYGLIMNDEKKKSLETVAGLTQFLRYSLYESNSDKLPVEKEVQLMKNYIDLESIRLNHINVNFNYESDGSIKNIAPLLLIPVIENAFKHTEDAENANINFDFIIKKNHIIFSADNSNTGLNNNQEIGNNQEKGGIGLANLQKRLNLYYKDRFYYKVSTTGEQYAVSINIESHE
ncbi:sensor histidine kinase [Flavitalea sp.]|nr:histidine kinase [Flavitalea sp.]